MQPWTNPWPQDVKLNPWLDRPGAPAAIQARFEAGEIDSEAAEKLLYWHRRGYLILPGIIDDARIEGVLAELDRFQTDGTIVGGLRKPLTKGPDGNFESNINIHMQSDALKAVFLDPTIMRWLALILGKPVYGCQTINFFSGSRRALHQDHLHMTTRPFGYLGASWIALEDIHASSGPLLYAPGSHWFPYFDAATLHAEGGDPNQVVAQMLEEMLREREVPTERFIAKKGDVFLWHANLAHGGAPVEDPALSRLSMACHYVAFGVDYYHDLSQRQRNPADVLIYDGRAYLPEYYDDEGRFAPALKRLRAGMQATGRL